MFLQGPPPVSLCLLSLPILAYRAEPGGEREVMTPRLIRVPCARSVPPDFPLPRAGTAPPAQRDISSKMPHAELPFPLIYELEPIPGGSGGSRDTR